MKPINDDYKSEIIDFIEQRVQVKSQTNEQMIRSLQLDLKDFKDTLETSLATHIEKNIDKYVNGKINKCISLIEKQNEKIDHQTQQIQPILDKADEVAKVSKFFVFLSSLIIKTSATLLAIGAIFGVYRFIMNL